MARAAAIYRDLGRQVVERLQSGPYRTIVSFAPATALGLVREWLGPDDLEFWPQTGADLGERMREAFERAFGQANRVCIVGTDIPDLNRTHVMEAFDLLDQYDAVFGPASDGGYYLLSLNRMVPALFDSISWSLPSVLDESEKRAQAIGLRTSRIDELVDLDTKADLAHLPSLRLDPRSVDLLD